MCNHCPSLRVGICKREKREGRKEEKEEKKKIGRRRRRREDRLSGLRLFKSFQMTTNTLDGPHLKSLVTL